MTPREWNYRKRIFSKAAGLDPSQREAYLKQACPNKKTREEIQALLAHHGKSRSFMGVYSSVGDKVLGHYEVRGRIGEGGMAVVYKARDTRLGRWVALKILHHWAMGQPRSRERLIQEARHASALNHPNIVTVHEIAEENGVYFIVMEYIAGKTLNRLIPVSGLPVAVALKYAMDIANALNTAHAAGIMHGDLKPLNIMVTGAGQVKLLDFGLATALASGQRKSKKARPSERFGTTAYTAPEQLRSEGGPDPRSEIFTFGLMLYEMVSGKHAFGGGTREQLADAIQNRDPADLPAGLPASIAKLVRRCLKKNPDRRFQSMQDLLLELTKCSGIKGPARLSLAANDAGEDRSAMRQIRTLTERIGYQNLAESRRAFSELARLINGRTSQAAREAVTSALLNLILNVGDFHDGVPAAVREVRKQALELLKMSTRGDLRPCFEHGELEYLNLYGMNFASEHLSGVSFKGCFLVAADFQGGQLVGASFAGACVRNVIFAGANLSGADLTDADWFNALGLTETQLRTARTETLLDCPLDVRSLHRHLGARYAFPFASWSTPVQEQLKAAWNEYLRPCGLRDAVAEWRRKSPTSQP